MKTPNYKKIALSTHKDMPTFQKWLQTEYHRHHIAKMQQSKYSLDNVAIAGLVFTMSEYDHDGRYITFGNKRAGLEMSLNTSDRYSPSGYSDATVNIYTTDNFREGITYLD